MKMYHQIAKFYTAELYKINLSVADIIVTCVLAETVWK